MRPRSSPLEWPAMAIANLLLAFSAERACARIEERRCRGSPFPCASRASPSAMERSTRPRPREAGAGHGRGGGRDADGGQRRRGGAGSGEVGRHGGGGRSGDGRHGELLFGDGRSGSMNDLTEFCIGSCYSLRMMENVDGGLLPCTLKELSMMQCGDLQLPLLDSLVGPTNLKSLNLCNCSRVKSLPSSEVFQSLTALREMVVKDCIFLSSLGGLGALSYLSWLEITDCGQLLVAAQ